MAIVANYQSIQDGQIKLETSGDLDWQEDFDLRPRVRLDKEAILQYSYLTDSNASSLELRFKINGNEIRTVGAFTGAVRGGEQEVFPGSHLQHGTNTIEVEIAGGTGDTRFSDLVLLYKVDN